MTLSSYEETNHFNTLGWSILIYMWFLLLMKSDTHIFFLILVILSAAFAFTKINDKKSDDIQKTPEPFYKTTEGILYAVAFVLTIVGVVVYMGEKKIEYGSEFSYTQFFGLKKTQYCSNMKSNDISTFEKFKSGVFK